MIPQVDIIYSLIICFLYSILMLAFPVNVLMQLSGESFVARRTVIGSHHTVSSRFLQLPFLVYMMQFPNSFMQLQLSDFLMQFPSPSSSLCHHVAIVKNCRAQGVFVVSNPDPPSLAGH